jgi:hypothetical protein
MGAPEGAAPDPAGACVLAEPVAVLADPVAVLAEPVLPVVVAVDVGLELLLQAPSRPTAALAARTAPSLVRLVADLFTCPPWVLVALHERGVLSPAQAVP